MKRGREALELGRCRGRALNRRQRHVELFGERGQHVALGHETHVHQDLADLVAALLLQLQGALQILGFDQAPRDQHLAQARRPGVRRADAAH